MQRWEIDCNNYASLSELLAQKRPAYMVTGDPVIEDGSEVYGMDDEPLLTNVRIVQRLAYDKLWAPAWGEMPEEFLDIGTDPDWLNTEWSEQDRRKAYAKTINHTRWSGHVIILHPDGRVQDYGNKKVGRGDLMLMMGGFDLTQGPVDVTYRDQKWRMFWLNGMHEENKPINIQASELLGRSTAVFRGAVALLQTTDRIDEGTGNAASGSAQEAVRVVSPTQLTGDTKIALPTLYRGVEGATDSKNAVRKTSGGDLGDGCYLTPWYNLAASYGGTSKSKISDGTRAVHRYTLKRELYPEEIVFMFGNGTANNPIRLVTGSGIEIWRGPWNVSEIEKELSSQHGIAIVIGTPLSLGVNQVCVRDFSLLVSDPTPVSDTDRSTTSTERLV